ncbi:MAG TPA: hypothetical protein VKE69_05990, partial [Planctomycetota bacterium]|nr:hypothetical protein [Planctomycetota bacterium]
MRLENGGEAKPTGLVISTAVPFAPGAVRDVAEIGLDAPGEVEPLETHRDGSVRWARVRVRPVWKGLRATFVELRRGGKRPELPTEAFGEPPPLSLVLEGQDGVERRAEIAPAQWRSIERSELREVLRASARHIATKATGGTALPPALFACELFLERFRGAPFVFATVVLRNDPPSDPVGAMRFRSYRLEVPAPWKTAVAWPQQNGVAIEAHSSGASVTWLLPRETADLWLGDGQTKAWRCLLDPSGDEARFRSLARVLEHPFLPGLKPAELVRSRAWGDLGDVVLGPPPEAASSLAQAEFARVHGTAGRPGEREYGWASAWGDVKDTHQTGSPRNGLCSDGVVRTLQTGFREWFDLAYERATQQALRPILRGLRAADHPQAMLYEGMPHPSWPDRLGRERDPDPNLGRFREGTAGGWLQETHGWNGFDEQHFTVDDLYAIHLLTGDPWVRFELESIGQA